MAKFNYRELARSVANSESGRKRVNTIMQRRFAEEKAAMLHEFDSHDVTTEIKAGVGAANTSRTLANEGDLFSFIGFEEGSDPVSEVRDILENDTVLISSKKTDFSVNRVKFKFSLRIPTEEIKSASPMPWESGNSWVDGIEKGISGFSNYLRGKFRSPEPSRSGGGKQVGDEIRTDSFKTRRYLSEIFSSFVAKFK